MLVVSHQANEIDSWSKRFQIIGALPVFIEPRIETCFARRARSVRHRSDADLQILRVQSAGRFLNHGRKQIAVGPVDIFKVELKTGVAVLFARVDEFGKHLAIGGLIGEELVNVGLNESGTADDGHYRNVMLARSIEYERIGAAGDEALGVDQIPCRDEDIDLVGMSEKGADGIGIAGHVKKGLGLLRRKSADREGKRDERDP